MSYDDLLLSIAVTLADYREGDMAPRSPADVQRWVEQFDEDARLDVLFEVDHALKRLYWSRAKTTKWLQDLASNGKGEHWSRIALLRLQSKQKSQASICAEFETLVRATHGVTVSSAADGVHFLYLDDGIFTGSSIIRDLVDWVENDAPAVAKLIVYVPVLHTYGAWRIDDTVSKAATKAKKQIACKVRGTLHVQDGIGGTFYDQAEVLRPTSIGTDPAVAAWVATHLTGPYAPRFRTPGAMPAFRPDPIFSSAARREVLEQQFLKAGVEIMNRCNEIKKGMRPLGFTHLTTFGFGTLCVRARNCPNNAPLALWWGTNGWTPLVPRDVSTAASLTMQSSGMAKAPASAPSGSFTTIWPSGPAEEDLELPWENDAKRALSRALDELTFDEEAGVAILQTDDGEKRFERRDQLECCLAVVYDDAWSEQAPLGDDDGDFAPDGVGAASDALGDRFPEELAAMNWD